jgi:Tol biopolymer transport system component
LDITVGELMMSRDFKNLLCFLVLLICISGCKDSLDNLEGISSIDLGTSWSIMTLDWSPDGEQILLFAENTGSDDRTYVVELETKQYRPIENNSNRISYETYGASWSPDGQRIVLYYPVATFVDPEDIRTTVETDTKMDIVLLDADTGQIAQEIWDGEYSTWGSDANEIIVVDKRDKHSETAPVLAINLSAGTISHVADINSHLTTEGLDASSSGLLAISDVGRIKIIDIVNQIEIGQIVSEKALYTPAWSPDGDILMYTQDNRDFEQNRVSTYLWLSNSNGSCTSAPLDLGVFIRHLDWSPTGNKIVFSTNELGKLFFLDLTTGIGKLFFQEFADNCL